MIHSTLDKNDLKHVILCLSGAVDLLEARVCTRCAVLAGLDIKQNG